MANTIGYGQGAVNNSNGWGKSATNNTIDFGEVCADSYSPETNLVGGSSFSNTYSTDYDGIDAYVSTDSTYSELDGQTKATFSCWIKPTTSAVNRNIFHIGNGATSGVSGVCQLWIRQGNRIDFSIDTGSYFGRADINSINYGSWNHILIAIDLDSTDEFKCYVNGSDATTLDNLGSRTSFSTATESLLIGEMGTGQYHPFLGNIDEFAIWSGTDLRNDVATIYNSGVPNNLNDNGLTAPTSWYRFEEGSGTTIADSGSSTNNATIQNSVTFETDVPT
tara:strand:+ start:933 stop:1766 length:834 start_codon:yes stop_codon:yes gene_type:complete